jgi:exonuclease III
MANLNIGSLNVKGLADEKKRKEVFNWLREKKMNVYMLQETHFTISIQPIEMCDNYSFIA